MQVVVILDVRAPEGRQLPRDTVEQVEEQLDGNFASAWLYPVGGGEEVPVTISVAGIGKNVAEAATSFAQRKQYARQD